MSVIVMVVLAIYLPSVTSMVGKAINCMGSETTNLVCVYDVVGRGHLPFRFSASIGEATYLLGVIVMV